MSNVDASPYRQSPRLARGRRVLAATSLRSPDSTSQRMPTSPASITTWPLKGLGSNMATVKSIIQDWLNEGRVAWISSQGLHPFALLDRRVDALSLSILTHVVQDDSIPKDATKEPDAP